MRGAVLGAPSRATEAREKPCGDRSPHLPIPLQHDEELGLVCHFERGHKLCEVLRAAGEQAGRKPRLMVSRRYLPPLSRKPVQACARCLGALCV